MAINGDTVYCKIKKIDLYQIKLDNNKILSVDSIRSFMFENTKWISYLIRQYSEKNKNIENINIFLPQVKRRLEGFQLGNWGKAFGIKHNYFVSCKTDGRTVLYEIEGEISSGYGAEVESTVYLKKDNLEVIKVLFAKKRSSMANQKIIEVLKKYTGDKPQIAKQLDNNFSAKYKNVKEYLEEYIQSK